MKMLIFLIGFFLLLPEFLLPPQARPTGTTGAGVPTINKVELKSAPSITSSMTNGSLLGSSIKLIDVLNNYARLIGAIASLCAVLVALYLGSWREIRRKPKLKLFFKENKLYPYYHKLAFGSFNVSIDLDGRIIDFLIPGFNVRIKVANEGKTTAKNVQARIEKIEFKNDDKPSVPTTYYHPTKVKWSGESTWNPIDIVPQSHFFLDVFHAINLSSDEIASFNDQELKRQRLNIDSDLLKDIIRNDVKPDEEVYWNVWVDSPYSRGVPSRYYFQGDIVIYFIINSENCDPLKFEALINWTVKAWNEPIIKIRMGKDYINNDEERGAGQYD